MEEKLSKIYWTWTRISLNLERNHSDLYLTYLRVDKLVFLIVWGDVFESNLAKGLFATKTGFNIKLSK